MDGFLKGYYGYKNLGDEILFFGVAKYIFENFNIDKLYVQVQDKDFFKKWLEKNTRHILSNVEVVGRNEKIKDFGKLLKFFGGGEVITDQRPFPYDGWNLLIKNFIDIYNKNFVLLGGIGTPKKLATKLLYKIILPKAQKIIVREKFSYDIALKYNFNTYLYYDFAYDIVRQYQTKIDHEKKVFLNINSYIYNDESIEKIKLFLKKYDMHEKWFVPFDMQDDVKYFSNLKAIFPDLRFYDWTQYDIGQIVSFLGSGEAGIGARLHFLLILKWLGKNIVPLAYQEKISKFFNENL